MDVEREHHALRAVIEFDICKLGRHDIFSKARHGGTHLESSCLGSRRE